MKANISNTNVNETYEKDPVHELEIGDCQSCGTRMLRLLPVVPGDLCIPCRRRFPPSLLKATYDTFTYTLKLRTGELFFFTSARIEGDYVTLYLDPTCGVRRSDTDLIPEALKPVLPFVRDVDVRLADIVWCADAPYGS